MHEALRQRIAVRIRRLRGEVDEHHVLRAVAAAGIHQPLFDDTARQGRVSGHQGVPRKVNELALTALRPAASRKASTIDEPILLDATRRR